MSAVDILMAADRVASNLLASVTGNRRADMEKDATAEKKLSAYARKNKRDEYLVRGAVLVCNKGSHKRRYWKTKQKLCYRIQLFICLLTWQK